MLKTKYLVLLLTPYILMNLVKIFNIVSFGEMSE